MNHDVHYDDFHDKWCCELGGPGDPKVVCNDKQQLEAFLDWLELNGKEVSHVGVIETAEASDPD